MIRKRGVSPLIATVLILGFTIALAAVIMTWGTGFVRNMQQTTEETSNTQISCATDVKFSIENACLNKDADSGLITSYDLTIKNDGAKEITKLTARLYESSSGVEAGEASLVAGATNLVGAFGVSEVSVTPILPAVDFKLAKKIEVFPTVKMGDKNVQCSANLESFGDLNSALLPCAA